MVLTVQLYKQCTLYLKHDLKPFTFFLLGRLNCNSELSTVIRMHNNMFIVRGDNDSVLNSMLNCMITK